MKSGTKQNLLVLTKGNEMAEKLIILDGSMGGELARRGYGKSDGIWSAKALVDAPEMVAEVHRDCAGAEELVRGRDVRSHEPRLRQLSGRRLSFSF